MSSARARILGCGSSAGVPRVAVGWGACDPANPRNRRRRCSLLVTLPGPQGETVVLVDTSPDLREQLLDAQVDHLDAVLYTHDHADHIHGIDDLRPLFIRSRQRLPAYMTPGVSQFLHNRFGYCFEAPQGSGYPPIVEERTIDPGKPFTVQGKGGDISVLPFDMEHGPGRALGFRFGGLAYASDVSAIPEDSMALLKGLDVLILDALRYVPHPTHFTVAEALAVIERLAPKRAVLTNLHIDLDYEVLKQSLPDGVEPAYDGMTLELDLG